MLTCKFSSTVAGFISAESDTFMEVLMRDSLPLSIASKILGETVFGEAKSCKQT